MKKLFLTTAVLEAGAGLGLLCCPSLVVTLLLGVPLEEPATLVVARVGGAGLLALGVACGLAQFDAQSCAARGLISGMVIYNLAAVIVLGVAGLQLRPVGIALWPAVMLHGAMTAWCVASLLRKPSGGAVNDPPP